MTIRLRHCGPAAAIAVCLGFTGGNPAWADFAQSLLPTTSDPPPPSGEARVADAMITREPSRSSSTESADLMTAIDAAGSQPSPYGSSIALHGERPARLPAGPPTSGPTARLGTSVGYVYDNPLDVLALGGIVGIGYRFDRVVVEAEYGYYRFQSHGAFPLDLGRANRLGVLARVDVLRSDPGSLGKNSRVAGYAEVGVARQANHWSRPAYNEAERDVPADTTHTEGTFGIGLRVDHGMRYPLGFPNRIGWLIGWRMVAAPHDPVPTSVCRGDVSCVQMPMTPSTSTAQVYGTALLFTTGLEATW